MTLEALSPSTYLPNPYAIPTFVAAAVSLFLGTLVLARERGSLLGLLFFLVTLPVSLWLFAFSWMYCSTDQAVAYWWAKAAYLGVPLLPSAVYHFTVVALQIDQRHKKLVLTSWMLSGLFSLLSLGSHVMVSGLYQYWWGYYPKYGWLSIPFLGFFFWMMFASLRHYWSEYRQASPGIRKRRIRLFMFAFIFAYLAALDYLPKFGIPLYPFGYLPVCGWLSLIAVAIWRHRFVDITPAFASEQILNTMADALLVFDREGIVRVVNRSACRLFGRTQTEMVGRAVSTFASDLFPKEKLDPLMQTGAAQSYQASYRTGSGEEAVLDISASTIQDRSGHTAAIVCITRDITERQRAEHDLQASEERFRSVAQSATDAIISADSSGHIVSWNRGAQFIFGYTEEEVLGQPLSLLMPERYREGHRRGLEQLRTTGEGQVIGKTVELHGVRKDGSEFPLELSLSTWRTRDGAFYSGIIRETTQRKQAEEVLRQTEEQLRQSQKMEAVGKLAGGVAHDFNNLLTIMTGHSQLLIKKLGKDSPMRRDVEEIKKASDRAAALTQQLLAFSRQQVLMPKVLALNEIVFGMNTMLQRLIGETIDLVTALDSALGHVKADPGQIEQVIMNLVLNARDAMLQGGRLTIETRNVEVTQPYTEGSVLIQPGCYVVLSVSDTGCGMDAETQTRIFDPFFTTKEPGKGTGLGLSTVYGIVEQSGGHILVSSELGSGTTFTIFLPRVNEDIPPIEMGKTSDAVPYGIETVLVVEDEPGVRIIVRDVLRQYGYTVLEARHGIEALQIGMQHLGPIHLLVADMVMPQMSGREMARRLLPVRPDLKVLYMSGYVEYAVPLDGGLVSETNFIQKPFTPEALVRKVRKVLDASREEA